MRITGIEKAKGRNYKIFVDGEYWYILHAELVVDHKLKEGLPVTEEQLEEIRYEADYRKARERALYLLEYRDHSRKELIDKLLRSVNNPSIAEEIADKMEEYGFLDDERYAKKLARDFLERKRLGKRRAGFEMMKKGVSRDLAQQVLEEYEIDPQEQLVSLLERKYVRYLGDEKGRRKVVNALLRLGHPYDEIKQALQQFEDQQEYDEEF